MNPGMFGVAGASKRFKRIKAVIPTPPPEYDLYATDSASRGIIPFPVNWPAAPAGTLVDVFVTNNTQLATAQTTANARIYVSAGSYNALTISRNDQHWICDDAAVFAGLGGNGFNRVRIDGGAVVTTGDVNPYNFNDLLIRNMNIRANSVNWGFGSLMFTRLAVIHCTIYTDRTGFFTPGDTANVAGVWAYDLIAAANYVSGGMLASNPGVEPAFRIQATRRCIMVDNRARCGFEAGGGGVVDTKNTYRSHYGTEDLWGRKNLTEWGDGVLWGARANGDPVQPNNRMGRHWWFDFDIYTERLSAYAFRGQGGGSIAADWLQPIVVDGNRGFTDVSANDNWIWQGQAGDTIGSNTTAAYQAAPSLASILCADGLPAGADH